MSTEAYELLALGLRYWFILLGLVIVLRAGRWAWHDRRVYQRTLSALPDAGLMGELVNLDTGEGLPLPREGVIGSGKASDIRLRGLRKREAVFELQEGQGVRLVSCHRRHQILLDGQPLGRTGYGLHGSRLSFPGYFLRMRLFEGLDIPARAASYDEGAAGQTQAAEDFNIEDYAQQGAIDSLPFLPPTLEQSIEPARPADREPGETLYPQITWVYAHPPVDDQSPVPPQQAQAWSMDDGAVPLYPDDIETTVQLPQPPARRRRGDRHAKD